ncbi:hypothetical protein EDB92DRAFT_74942 [Lactarius akahatsu]|uniref:Uncharacterized protein n=1 Tax=Lactarius akahatsu TaxID=416441 RepID=A0AAD4LTC3_9AGAM|nr:hypothetical protein EDB92DRAFT_74942 [Lactarius akahatsu]
MLDLTNLSSALEGPQDGRSTSMSTNSSYLCRRSTSFHHCTTCYTLFSRSEPSRNQSFFTSSRPLPTPPLFAPPLSILSASSPPTPSSSTSSVTTTPHLLSCHSQSISVRPLPKMPRSTSTPLGTTRRGTSTEARFLPPASPTDLAGSSSAPQQPANEIRRGDLHKLQCHPGKSTPTDLVPPKLDAGELSDSPSSDEEQYFDPPLALITPEYLTELTDAVPHILEARDKEPVKLVKRFSRRWLREKNGRRWVEENYDAIAQCLRELR